MRTRFLRLICAGIWSFTASPLVAASSLEVPNEKPAEISELPFNKREVVDYFSEAFGQRPERIKGTDLLFSDRLNPDESVYIAVKGDNGGLAIVLLANGDYGVNYFREFFEAPFFRSYETEQLYDLLGMGAGVRSTNLGRFDVQINYTESDEWLMIALGFFPPGTINLERLQAADSQTP